MKSKIFFLKIPHSHSTWKVSQIIWFMIKWVLENLLFWFEHYTICSIWSCFLTAGCLKQQDTISLNIGSYTSKTDF